MKIVSQSIHIKVALLAVALFFAHEEFAQTLDSTGVDQTIRSFIGNPSQLDSIAKVLLKEVEQDFVLEDTYHYNLSRARFLTGQLDEAFKSAEKGVALCIEKDNTLRSAKFYNLQASVYAYKKDNQKAIETFKTSLAILEEAEDTYTAAQVQNNIANIFFGLSDYNSAYKYSRLSYDELLDRKDTVHLPGVAGILAVSALKLGRLTEGKQLAEESLSLSTQFKNPVGLIVSNYSLGEVFIADSNYVKAIQFFEESLKLSEMYRQGHFVMLNKIGLQAALRENKEYQKSVEIGEQALIETLELNNENTLYAIHKNLGYAYKELGKLEQSASHLATAHELYIESSGVENQKAINDILIKYDTEKKEKDLVLSRLENVENQNKSYKRLQWIIILATALALVLLSYFFFTRLQKQRVNQLQQEQKSKRILAAVQAEEKERERISNELHDGMASTITGIKLKLEDFAMDSSDLKLTPLVNQLQSLHDETRRMSHNLMPLGLNKENWTERLAEYCRENSNKSFKILFSNNLKQSVSLDPSVSILLYRSVQELIHNVQKHAQSPSCFVQISQLSSEVIISVEDEGTGFDSQNLKGQGLVSIGQRLEDIGAEMGIESKVGEGSLITLSMRIA